MCRRVGLCLGMAALAAVAVLVVTSVPAQPPSEAAPRAATAKEAVPAPPPAGVKTASNRVVAVTVYPNSALVTREVEVPAGAGPLELTVTPLPPQTVNSSLYSEGTTGVRVLTTRFRTRQLMEDTREDVRRLQDELKQLQLAKDKMDADIKGIQTNLQLLSKMENFTAATTAHVADKGTANSDSAIALSKYIMDCRMEKTREQVALQQQVQDNQEKAEFAQRKLKELAAGSSRTEQDAIIVVDRANGAGGKVRLNYLVDAASWRPQYRLRAGKAAKDPVQLEYLAGVVQQTGESWDNVKLVLSTAQPMLNAAPADLQVLQVTATPPGKSPHMANGPDVLAEARNLRSQAQKDFNDQKQISAAKLCNAAAALDQSFELLNPNAMGLRKECGPASREGPSVTYHLDTRLTVPSRNDEHILEVARLELTPEYYYKAVPILSSHVYRLADLVNKSNHVLLPGEATMYVDSDFVGRMNLPLVAVGEQFTAGFGVDPQLQVQRQMIDQAKTIQGGNQVLKVDFRLLASSYKTEPVKLQIWDRLPHPENENVGVNLLKTAPELSRDPLYLREQRPNNLLRWDVQLAPHTNGEKALAITYDFKLELDRNMTIGGFQTAAGPRVEPTLTAALPPMSPAEAARVNAAMAKLTPDDRKLAQAQVFCAIEEESRLGSQGPILKVMCKGQPVFVCCRGCEADAKANPDATLARCQRILARVKAAR